MCDVCVCVCVFVCVCVCECQHQMKARADKHRREVVYSPGDIHGDAQYEKHEAWWVRCKKAASITYGCL